MLLLASPAPKNSARGSRSAWPPRAFAITSRVLRYGPALSLRSPRTLRDSNKSWSWWHRSSAWLGFTLSWQLAAAGAFALLLLASGGWLYRTQVNHPTTSASQNPLLHSKALGEVERAEAAYVQAIDKLDVEAKPQLDNPDTPLLANYREKLQVLDSAIDDLRAQTGMNPSNAHLRYQLLAMYQEKQRTLEEVLETKR